MEKGKNKVDPIVDEEERRWLKALGDFAIISKQFHALMQNMNEWQEQHRASSNGLHLEGAHTASKAEESASALQVRATELVDILQKFQRDMQDGYCEASTSRRSQAADQKPEEQPLVEQKPEVPPADPKLEPSSP